MLSVETSIGMVGSVGSIKLGDDESVGVVGGGICNGVGIGIGVNGATDTGGKSTGGAAAWANATVLDATVTVDHNNTATAIKRLINIYSYSNVRRLV